MSGCMAGGVASFALKAGGCKLGEGFLPALPGLCLYPDGVFPKGSPGCAEMAVRHVKNMSGHKKNVSGHVGEV